MAKVKKAEAEAEEVKKVSPKTSKKAAPAKEEKEDREGIVTLKELCEDRGINPRDARIQLRRSMEREDGARWEWEEGSKELGEVETLLDEYLKRKANRGAKEDEEEEPAPKAKAKRTKRAKKDEDEDEDEDD